MDLDEESQRLSDAQRRIARKTIKAPNNMKNKRIRRFKECRRREQRQKNETFDRRKGLNLNLPRTEGPIEGNRQHKKLGLVAAEGAAKPSIMDL